MNRSLFFSINLVLIFAFLFTSCGPVTPVVITTPTVAPTQTPPDIHVQEDEVPPDIVEQNPPVGQRLQLSSEIRFRFDRDMDREKTAAAFTLVDPKNEQVPGRVTWPNQETLSFKPDSPLKASSTYHAIFSASAAGADGKQLQDELRLEFNTTDRLSVSEVFPIHDAEDVDSSTNITVIFNQPVVPLDRHQANDLVLAARSVVLHRPFEINELADRVFVHQAPFGEWRFGAGSGDVL